MVHLYWHFHEETQKRHRLKDSKQCSEWGTFQPSVFPNTSNVPNARDTERAWDFIYSSYLIISTIKNIESWSFRSATSGRKTTCQESSRKRQISILDGHKQWYQGGRWAPNSQSPSSTASCLISHTFARFDRWLPVMKNTKLPFHLHHCKKKNFLHC